MSVAPARARATSRSLKRDARRRRSGSPRDLCRRSARRRRACPARCARRSRLHDRARSTRAAGAASPLTNVGDDGVAVFGARVVVGDDDLIGESLGDRAHQRPLARIAIAAAAEDADQLAAACACARQRALSPTRRACARSRRSRAACRCAISVSMRPGGGLQRSSAAIASCNGTFQPSSAPSAASRFSTLKSPMKRECSVATPQLPSTVDIQAGRAGSCTRLQTGDASPSRMSGSDAEREYDGAASASAGVATRASSVAAERVVDVDDRVLQARPREQLAPSPRA